MTLSDLSIQRPVLATVFSLLIVLVGCIAFVKLPVREYPDIDAPIVTVTTVYPGANATIIESEVTNIIEEELTSIEGIRNITSTSRDQVSSVVVEFRLSRDIDIAAQDVREKIARVEFKLPDNVDKPQYDQECCRGLRSGLVAAELLVAHVSSQKDQTDGE